ncbi:MAG: hypothetical protein M5U01_09285 [Ardenticatenaceae bacterium]|nr:hypothetical protein [Ardenticatenaceae bacterium]
MPGEAWQILAKLGELYQKRSDEEQAQRAFVRAAEIVQSLAGKIEDEELRAGFLAAEPVRRVMSNESLTTRGRKNQAPWANFLPR